MIDREHLSYIDNILSLTNHKADTGILYDVLTAIKEDDSVSFLQKILTTSKNDIDLLTRVYKTVEQFPGLEVDILDSFSNNQLKSKSRVLQLVEENNFVNTDSEVIIFGSWYGSILIPGLCGKVKRISCIDLDEQVLKIAKNRLFPDVDNVDYIAADVFEKDRERYWNADLFINTSCEHMPPMNTWPYWPKNTNFVFTSNNMYDIEGHVNCVYSMADFKSQLPANSIVLSEDEITDERGTRFLVAGHISA